MGANMATNVGMNMTTTVGLHLTTNVGYNMTTNIPMIFLILPKWDFDLLFLMRCNVPTNVSYNASPWKINLSFLLCGDRRIPEIHAIQKKKTGWTFEMLAGRAKYWLDVRRIGWTFKISTGHWECRLGIGNVDWTLGMSAGHWEYRLDIWE